MKVIKVKILDGYVLPVSLDDQPIFQHCAGGMCAVTPKYLVDTEPVFALHNVTVSPADYATEKQLKRAKAK